MIDFQFPYSGKLLNPVPLKRVKPYELISQTLVENLVSARVHRVNGTFAEISEGYVCLSVRWNYWLFQEMLGNHFFPIASGELGELFVIASGGLFVFDFLGADFDFGSREAQRVKVIEGPSNNELLKLIDVANSKSGYVNTPSHTFWHFANGKKESLQLVPSEIHRLTYFT